MTAILTPENSSPVGDHIDLDWIKWKHTELDEEEAAAFYESVKNELPVTDLYYIPHGELLYARFFNGRRNARKP